jgi:hypothetical protein
MVIARRNASLQDVLSVPQPLVVVSEGRVQRVPALCTRQRTPTHVSPYTVALTVLLARDTRTPIPFAGG